MCGVGFKLLGSPLGALFGILMCDADEACRWRLARIIREGPRWQDTGRGWQYNTGHLRRFDAFTPRLQADQAVGLYNIARSWSTIADFAFEPQVLYLHLLAEAARPIARIHMATHIARAADTSLAAAFTIYQWRSTMEACFRTPIIRRSFLCNLCTANWELVR